MPPASPSSLRSPVPVNRVALVYSPIASGVPLLTSVERVQRRPGLGLRYLKAVLLGAGVKVDLYDNLYDPAAAERVHLALNRERYDLVGFHTTSASRSRVLATVSRLDHAWYSGRVLAGGPGALHDQDLLAGGVDVVVHGEGERAILDLLAACRGEVTLESIPGLSYRRDGHAISTGAPLAVDLASLPLPDWQDHDPLFGDMFNITLKRPFYVVMASRGCPFRCGFCASHQQWRRRYRARPVERVLDEVEWLIRSKGARYIHFLDDIFGLEPGWADAFCLGMHRRRLRVDCAVVLHPLSFQHDQRGILTRLAEVGCKLVSIGAQSADPDVLRGINRSVREPDGIRELLAVTHDLQLASVLTYIFGLPGDTHATIRRSIDFAR